MQVLEWFDFVYSYLADIRGNPLNMPILLSSGSLYFHHLTSFLYIRLKVLGYVYVYS